MQSFSSQFNHFLMSALSCPHQQCIFTSAFYLTSHFVSVYRHLFLIIYYLIYFYYYLCILLYFLVLFIGLIILFQQKNLLYFLILFISLIVLLSLFTVFLTKKKKISISIKYVNPKQTLNSKFYYTFVTADTFSFSLDLSFYNGKLVIGLTRFWVWLKQAFWVRLWVSL